MPEVPLPDAFEWARYPWGPAIRCRALDGVADHCFTTRAPVWRVCTKCCASCAPPDNAAVLAQVQAMLAGFSERADLRTHRAALADSGIAGTPIHYRFFAGQAQWLAQHWPDKLRLDRDDTDAETRIAHALPPLLTRAGAHALIELKLPGYAALDRLRGSDETDAVCLLRRMAAMPGDGFTREAFRALLHWRSAPARSPRPRSAPES